jgi:hypothetical protein
MTAGTEKGDPLAEPRRGPSTTFQRISTWPLKCNPSSLTGKPGGPDDRGRMDRSG